MSFALAACTILHVAISVAGIFSGLVVLAGVLSGKHLGVLAAVFLAATVLTSVTGFFFPVHHFMPSHAVGILSGGLAAIRFRPSRAPITSPLLHAV